MRISVKAKPGAREEKIIKISDTKFEVWVKEPPIQGRANYAIIRALAEYFSVSVSNIRIVAGRVSRQKIIEIKI